uniref:7TM GPCR serpentine receptor class x (Srx) domain-containing protein n=1 Tax=Meloidogyne enterolobii TaxID=390850 RepID=A0A6V7TZR0_MELEN|nr:unnamed protein product [Meloidogyne enterolobii]
MPFNSYFISPAAAILTTSIYVHITALALNRFQAVYFTFSYEIIWKKRNIKYIIFIIWCIIIFWYVLLSYITLNFKNLSNWIS